MLGYLTHLLRAGRYALAVSAASLIPFNGQAEILNLPAAGNDLVGQLKYVKARHDDTLIDIAHDFSVGQDEIVMANPTVSRWLPGDGTKVLIPDRFILPDVPRTGIVVNIPEMRLYFFPPGEGKNPPPPTQVITYPISIGRMDWKSPMGVTKIVEKIKDPSWTPPESIKKEHALDGEILPDVVPPGPDNPLGRFAMRLGVKGSYLIHGTGQDKADGIGMMVTHGCMRMYPEDVEQLFPKVNVGTQVNLINQPVKLGWQGNALYIEVSQPMDEDHLGYDKLLSIAMGLIQKRTEGRPDFVLNGEALKQALQKPNGIPVAISGGQVGGIMASQRENIPLVSRSSRGAVPVANAPAESSVPSATPAMPPQTMAAPLYPRPNPAALPMPSRATTDPVQGAPYPAPTPQTPRNSMASNPAPLASPAPRPVDATSIAVPRVPAVAPSKAKPEQQLLPPIY